MKCHKLLEGKALRCKRHVLKDGAWEKQVWNSVCDENGDINVPDWVADILIPVGVLSPIEKYTPAPKVKPPAKEKPPKPNLSERVKQRRKSRVKEDAKPEAKSE